jgi:transposase-like protein
MEKKDKGRRVYTKEFKAEALAEKREKPVSRIAVDLEVNESVPRRWMRQAREAERGGLPPFPGHGTGSWPGCGKKTRRCGRRCEAPLHSKS